MESEESNQFEDYRHFFIELIITINKLIRSQTFTKRRNGQTLKAIP